MVPLSKIQQTLSAEEKMHFDNLPKIPSNKQDMTRQFFGTDGIRGKANVFPMTGEVAMMLGRAVTFYFQQKTEKKSPLIIVGKDTRLSCYMIEQAFSAGVCSQGGRVILTGPLPTPGVSFVTTSMRADAGVMISASHNSYEDNGIKIFDSKGMKLPDEVEWQLEQMLLHPEGLPLKVGTDLGRAKRIDEIEGRYVVFVKSSLDSQIDFEGMRIVLDCANGAGYKCAPLIFSELGAEVIPLSIQPNGKNINLSCGSLYPREAQETVMKYRADLGICLDGDGDRVVVIDELGQVADGDKVLALFAKLLLDGGKLKKGDEVIGTVMSNMGLEHYIKNLGLKFHRVQVGDRYILERMQQSKAKLGGEPSGHIIFSDHSLTGDGALCGLKVLEAMKRFKKPASELLSGIQLFPSLLKNIVVEKRIPFEQRPLILEAVKDAERTLGTKGRILLRYSGTEAKVRLMVEGEDNQLIQKISEDLCEVLVRELNSPVM